MSQSVETEEPEDWRHLLAYVGSGTVDQELVKSCWEQAVALVNRYVGDVLVPAAILRLAYTQTGSELYARRNAPSGITGFADGSENPIRLARDPMTSVYPLLRGFVGFGVA